MSFTEFLIIAVLIGVLLKRHSLVSWVQSGSRAWNVFKKTLHESPIREVEEYRPTKPLSPHSEGVADV